MEAQGLKMKQQRSSGVYGHHAMAIHFLEQLCLTVQGIIG